jgi:hypothetical protein
MHHFPDPVVDAVAPSPALLRRRSSTFCKAPLKKSASFTFRASASLSQAISSRNACSPGRRRRLSLPPGLALPAATFGRRFPLIQQHAIDAQFPSQLHDVVGYLHPLHRLPLELGRILRPLLFLSRHSLFSIRC